MNQIENGFKSTRNFKKIEKDIFKDLEIRLKLRALLARYKAEYFSKPEILKEKFDNTFSEKIEEKRKILEKFQKQKEIKNI
jgi:hypothetical protein